ncbi:uncharacterized protein ARMOST_20109 [Armillaria ostoyae]|uniref:Metallo-beta-lactamase domain-containing protein n=1 Tax=Armillaria ostoyae TaxID=47428 RepID=A0A284S6E9_ARMOS|nr:uncharacterized protein ARMOST_20109 [Armillaria ostoyae]
MYLCVALDRLGGGRAGNDSLGELGCLSLQDREAEEDRPVCPAFKDIEEKFGGFDVAMIPIMAYKLRWFMSTIHGAPEDSVRIFKDVGVKKAIAIHLDTDSDDEGHNGAAEEVEERKKICMADGDCLLSDVGETKFF